MNAAVILWMAWIAQLRAPWKNAGVHSLVSAPYDLSRSGTQPQPPPHADVWRHKTYPYLGRPASSLPTVTAHKTLAAPRSRAWNTLYTHIHAHTQTARLESTITAGLVHRKKGQTVASDSAWKEVNSPWLPPQQLSYSSFSCPRASPQVSRLLSLLTRPAFQH